jgi:hypothetical protein
VRLNTPSGRNYFSIFEENEWEESGNNNNYICIYPRNYLFKINDYNLFNNYNLVSVDVQIQNIYAEVRGRRRGGGRRSFIA